MAAAGHNWPGDWKSGRFRAGDLLPPRVHRENFSTRTRKGKMEGHGRQAEAVSACALTPPASPLLHLLLEPLAWQWSFGVLFSPTPSHGQGRCPLWVPCQLLNWSEWHPSVALLPSWGHCRDTSSSPPVKCLVQSGHLKDNWRHKWSEPLPSGLISSAHLSPFCAD